MPSGVFDGVVSPRVTRRGRPLELASFFLAPFLVTSFFLADALALEELDLDAPFLEERFAVGLDRFSAMSRGV